MAKINGKTHIIGIESTSNHEFIDIKINIFKKGSYDWDRFCEDFWMNKNDNNCKNDEYIIYDLMRYLDQRTANQVFKRLFYLYCFHFMPPETDEESIKCGIMINPHFQYKPIPVE